MTKYIFLGILALLIAVSWWFFYRAGNELVQLQAQIDELSEMADPEGEIPALKSELVGAEGTRIFGGILLTFLCAGAVGIVFATQVLPIIAHKFTHAIYDSGEEVEPDAFREARVAMAQGEWLEAIAAFRKVIAEDPGNRQAYVEIAKIQEKHLEVPAAAVETLRASLEEQTWEIDDAAFLMFRLAEVYEGPMDDLGAAAVVMEQVMEQFPDTRHAANARSKLHEWGMA